MSRSYKKHPYCGDKKGKSKKQIANSIVRQWLKDHPDEILSSSDYKKIYCTYEICDWGWILTWEQYWNFCKRWHEESVRRGWGSYQILDKKEEYRYWKRHYKNK